MIVGLFAKGLGKVMGKTAQEAHIVGKISDSLASVGIEFAGGVSINVPKQAGYALDAIQAYGGIQTISLGVGLVGYTSATWLPPVLAFTGGLELGFAFNNFYERLSGQALGADIYDWTHKNNWMPNNEECQ